VPNIEIEGEVVWDQEISSPKHRAQYLPIINGAKKHAAIVVPGVVEHVPKLGSGAYTGAKSVVKP